MNRRSFLMFTAALLIGAVFAAGPVAADETRYTVTDLGALPNTGKPFSGSWQQCLNNAGEVAVFVNSNADDLWGNAFLGDSPAYWSKGRLTALPELPGAVDTIPFHLNNRGQMVGRATVDFPFNHAVLWDKDGIHQLPELSGDVRSAALAINDRGEITGYSRSATERHGAYWFRGKVSRLPSLPGGGGYDEGLGIREDGVIVGFSGPAFGSEHPALWDKHGVHDLGTLGGAFGDAYQINERGQVAGVAANASGYGHPCLWNFDRIIDLGLLGSDVEGTAYAINNKGVIVGSTDDGVNTYGYHAFVWKRGKLTALQSTIPADSGWVLLQAGGINQRGQITGTGLHNGVLRGFLLTPVDDDDND